MPTRDVNNLFPHLAFFYARLIFLLICILSYVDEICKGTIATPVKNRKTN